MARRDGSSTGAGWVPPLWTVRLPDVGGGYELHACALGPAVSVTVGQVRLVTSDPEVLVRLGRLVELARADLVAERSGQNVLPFRLLPGGLTSDGAA